MLPSSSSATRILTIMSAAIFATELVIMFALQNVTLENALAEAVVDAIVLTLVLFPVLYFFVFRALVDKNRALAAAERELEQRVAQRTGELQQSNFELSGTLHLLESQHEEMATLGEIGQLFQACRDPEEAYEVAAAHIQHLYQGVPGALYLFRSSRNILERAVTWCADDQFVDYFDPDDCWALRREQAHETTEKNASYSCRHIKPHEGVAGLCLPISAHGETLGVLCLDTSVTNNAGSQIRFETKAAVPFLTAVAESLALAISNIRFREVLRNQALRDQLTGLYNRRFLEETMEIEIHRATRSDEPFSMIMIDVDHFKKFNDVYGHDGGDSALVALSEYLHGNMRKGDVACRFGGEEFVVLMPNAEAKAAMRRAEQIRRGVEGLVVEHEGTRMTQITISCGVACFPAHARNGSDLVRAADQALYESKTNGRNRVSLADITPDAGQTTKPVAAE